MMKRNIEKRVARLEQALLPKPTRPRLRIVERHVNDLGEDVDAAGRPVTIKPGPIPDVLEISADFLPNIKPKDDPDTLVIEIVETRKTPTVEAEPDDDELSGAIAELEQRLKNGGGRP